MNPDPLDTAEIAKAADPKAAVLGTTIEARAGKGSIDVEKIPAMTETSADVMEYDDTPTEEEMQTLRRVSGQIPWSAFTIAFCKYLRAVYPLFPCRVTRLFCNSNWRSAQSHRILSNICFRKRKQPS